MDEDICTCMHHALRVVWSMDDDAVILDTRYTHTRTHTHTHTHTRTHAHVRTYIQPQTFLTSAYASRNVFDSIREIDFKCSPITRTHDSCDTSSSNNVKLSKRTFKVRVRVRVRVGQSQG